MKYISHNLQSSNLFHYQPFILASLYQPTFNFNTFLLNQFHFFLAQVLLIMKPFHYLICLAGIILMNHVSSSSCNTIML